MSKNKDSFTEILSKDFIQWLQKHSRRPRTAKAYLYVLKKYQASGLSVLQYADSIADKKMFLTQFRAAVIKYGKYCKGKGDRKLYHEVMDTVDNINIQKPFERVAHILSDQEFETISGKIHSTLSSLENYFIKVPYMAIAFMLFAGLRIGECLNLQRGNIQTREGMKVIFISKEIGKGGKERVVNISNKLLKLYQLFFYKSLPKNQDRLFINQHGNLLTSQTIRKYLLKIYKEMQLSRYINPHLYRHTFASYELNRGVNVRIIQQLLGHVNLSTTQRYLEVSLKDQQRAVDKI